MPPMLGGGAQEDEATPEAGSACTCSAIPGKGQWALKHLKSRVLALGLSVRAETPRAPVWTSRLREAFPSPAWATGCLSAAPGPHRAHSLHEGMSQAVTPDSDPAKLVPVVQR